MPDTPTRSDPDKEDLARRIQDAQSRLHRLEWEADVMRRRQIPPDQKENEQC